VTGPTAAGKTPLAIAIGERFGGEIINADSMQVYRYMDIGTAKPSLEEQMRVPHHLIDIVTPDKPYNAGLYQRDARRVAAAIIARGNFIVLAGGTGLYIRAFLEGLLDTGAADPELRAELELEQSGAEAAGDPERLYRRLLSLDPLAAERIHPNDARRVIRALEIGHRGEPASLLRARHDFADRPYRTLHLAIDPGRDVLNERIDARCEAMIESGLLQETRSLRERGYGAELRPMQSIGYRHMNPVVDGRDTLANALRVMQRDTRRFARRQRTWLRKVPDTVGFDPADSEAIFARIEAFLAEHAARAPEAVATDA
jgi:tRNA dimethylallyltransferase